MVAVWIGVPLLALAVDWWLGEPPAAWHPVVWMGRALQWWGERLAPTIPVSRDLKLFWRAALVWCVLIAIVLIVAWLAQQLVLMLHGFVAAALLALLLKPLLAWRMLHDEVLAVEVALGQSLPAGRAQLSRLVSRDVSALTAVQVRESAIESLAENLNDSVVAPLFWFALLGLPGAALYRFANTADAMWGYPGMRGGRYWQWAGKWAARADDVLSWVPARITALLMAAGAKGLPLRSLARQARKTPSPNSGWPMAAMALALGVRLAKPGVYTLNSQGRRAGPLDTRRAARMGSQVVLALVPLVVAIQLMVLGVVSWLLA
ncbi:MAG: adenosylcobinamide-phosphate synthase CbiB [Gammaproteobacteria bacterium]|nr:adenosylcobinamide-phosphate synthase CbiB [Gammaproteobacteria bacterium]MBU1508372.1 adenosylcobinamide-phosphate synthase CbiB [Gammaproteobacteria bacterium]MBU2120212.1 adenosylcobinamide-phosphate synthase CbiB [Gammaproteobacteria bacterium]MBU2171669.1 adenosylcobinamide-phosphate synthase CbiB [Gammaproteobacteria bacterium]MBU2201942.1 adenosylcobinamide-phosphate synthase CbiB [Gammaproteobacteria bacterium]